MPAQLSNALMSQLFAQESGDALLTLITLDHPSFGSPVRLVNNSSDVVSRGILYTAFPFRITLPADDGEKAREVDLVLDNVSLEIIGYLRSVTEEIPTKLEIILASIPDEVQISMEGLVVRNMQYNLKMITAKLGQDNFMFTEMTSEKYTPLKYPGLF